MTVKTSVSHKQSKRDKIRKIEEELDDLRRQGVPIGVDATYIFELEEKGFVVDIETGRPINPFYIERSPVDRDPKGRFRPGNMIARKGGKARGAQLGKRRRRQIAKMGRRAMVAQHFGGRDDLQRAYFADLGRWNSEKVFEGTSIPVRAFDPGKPADWLRRRFPPNPQEVDFYAS